MKTTLGIGLIALVVFFGSCSSNQTPQTVQPDATAQPGPPVETAPASPPAQEVAASEETANYAPPPLPVYDQPDIPGPGYIWTPGYWAWSAEDGDYYWVPGTWVLPPEAGVLWTPGYWDSDGGGYRWHRGYWGSHVGYYGDVDYGYGYTGDGYVGGRWDNGNFYYNRAVNNISRERRITNVYDQAAGIQLTVNNPSYHGGRGGTSGGLGLGQRLEGAERHIQPTNEQVQHQDAARGDRALWASQNRGRPPVAATSRPGMFSGGAVVATRAAAPYQPPPQETRGRNEPHQQVAQPGYEPRPQEGQPRYEPRQPVAQPGYQPRPQEAQPGREPRQQTAQPGYQPRPQEVQPRNEPRPQAEQPRYEPHPQAMPQRQAPPPVAQPRYEPRPQAQQPQHQAPPPPPQPRVEPHPQAAQPQHQAPPPAAQPRNAPPPRNEPHQPEEKPKEEH